MYIATIFVSMDEAIIILIIWEMFNTALLFIWVSLLSDNNKFPPACILALG